MLADLADACRKSGLKVVEVSGWQSRRRPGSFAPRGVVAHHTGSGGDGYGYAAGTLVNGVSGLPGPLCQLSLGRDGTVYVIAAGRANHAGKCRSVGFMTAGDGNTQAIGIEAHNSGSEGWSDIQIAAYIRLCAALCDHYGWPRSHVVAHAECSTAGKWDPGFGGRVIDMNAFRAGVAGVPAGGSMALSNEDLIDILESKFTISQGGKTRTVTVKDALAAVYFYGDVLHAGQQQILAGLKTIPGVDPAAIQAVVEKGISDALASIETTVTVKKG